jgi:DNA/RNA endonuclease G (NUC1)
MRFFAAAVAFALSYQTGMAQELGFDKCAAVFPGGALSGAPTSAGSSNRMDLCYRAGATPFFAVKYNTSRRLADWVAYRVANTFGEDQCGSIDREAMGCYFQGDDSKACVADEKGTDPFHVDQALAKEKKPRLHIQIYKGTQHDRGHMAPNNAFSWHLCGAYQTFTMANMVPQYGWLNRTPWAALEKQELFWGVRHGPVYVTTGPIFAKFPVDKFEAFEKNSQGKSKLDWKKVDQPGTILDTASPDDPVVPVPTGFFKIIYKPARGNEPARAIGFLLPHTVETGFEYGDFMTRIDLIERVSGLKFPIPESTKDGTGTGYWTSREVPGNWSVRAPSCRPYTPKGWDKTIKGADARIAACVAAGTD